MPTKKKPRKGRVAAKKPTNRKEPSYYKVKPHRYSVTFATGCPLKYETAEALAKEVDAYYEYIQGEFEEQEMEYKSPKTGRVKKVKQRVCIREAEPATITGLTLYLGFSSMDALDDYSKRTPEFSEVVKRAKLRVVNRYERNLSGNSPTGSIFALKNMGWNDGNFLGDGAESTGGIIAFKYIIPPKPDNDDE